MSKEVNIVGERIIQLLKSRHMRQSYLAEKAGISRYAISKAITGEAKLSIDNAIKIADYFGVSLDYIYGKSEFESTYLHTLDIINKYIQFKKRDFDKFLDGETKDCFELYIQPSLDIYLKAIATETDFNETQSYLTEKGATIQIEPIKNELLDIIKKDPPDEPASYNLIAIEAKEEA